MNTNFTITETFKAVPKTAPNVRKKTVTVEQRYYGNQVIKYNVIEEKSNFPYPSDLFWAAFARK